jgi:transcriptional regulator with XRE-family HTH domain
MESSLSNALESSGYLAGRLRLRMKRMTFAKRFRESRLKAGLTQEELAQAIGVTNRTVSAWETGRAADVLAENLFAAADKMGVDPRWLATGVNDTSKKVTDITQNLGSLSPEKLETLRALLRSLKD